MTQVTGATIEIADEQGATRRVPLQGETIIIGRTTQAGLRLEGPSVSRRHASLSRDAAGRWWVHDLDSHNGTYVNGERTARSAITAGDTVQIDTFTLRLLPDVRASAGQRTAERPPQGEATLASPPAQHDDAADVSILRHVEPPHVSTPHLSLLSRFGSELIHMADEADRLKALCRLIVGREFQAWSAMALRLVADADSGVFTLPEPAPPGAIGPAGTAPGVLCPVQTSDDEPDRSPYLSRTLLRALRDSGEPVMASNVRRDARGSAGRNGTSATGAAGTVEMSIGADVKPMAAMACPLQSGEAAATADEAAMDVLYITLPPAYATGEWLALVSLAVKQYQQAELAWAGRRHGEALAAIERELEQARQIQMRLVPQRRVLAGLDTGIAFEPCRWVGGDYADILPMKDGRVLLAVADVCGKGMQAALTTASVHTMVHASVRSGVDLPELMANLNEYLVETLPDSSFVTMTAMALDPHTGEIACINAGHPPAFVIAPEGTRRRLQEAANLPLGIMAGELDMSHDRIDPHHWLTMYSDGLSELTDAQGQMLGIDGLGEQLGRLFAASHTQGAHELAQQVMQYVHQTQGKRLASDDYTLLVAQRT